MYKKIFLLNGLAIIGVVVSHATGWIQTVLLVENWYDRVREFFPLGYNPQSSFLYFYSISVRQLVVFSVAAFLFVSGLFTSYAMGGKKRVDWKFIGHRLIYLVIPYLIWSVLIFISEYFQDIRFSAPDYLRFLLTVGADGPYYYVPLICYTYLLAPFLVLLAVKNSKGLIIAAASLQFFIIGLRYLQLMNVNLPHLDQVVNFFPNWSPLRWILYFPLGLVSGLHLKQFTTWLSRHSKAFLAITIVMIPTMVLEYELVYRTTGVRWGNVPHTFSTIIYSLAFIFLFLSLKIPKFVFPKWLYLICLNTYGIYLLHMKLMEFVSRLSYHYFPQILVKQWVFQPFLLVLGIGVPLLFMSAIAKSSFQRYYRFLFG